MNNNPWIECVDCYQDWKRMVRAAKEADSEGMRQECCHGAMVYQMRLVIAMALYQSGYKP